MKLPMQLFSDIGTDHRKLKKETQQQQQKGNT